MNDKKYRENVSVKSKYLCWEQERQLIIHPAGSSIMISQTGNPSEFKEFHID
jgi:hypothetical protein